MGIENSIEELLSQGLSPTEIIEQHHYKKSTVYKVFTNLKMEREPITEPSWKIENIQFNKDRYLQKEKLSIRYGLKNDSEFDLYVYRIGIQPEWLRNEWYVQGERFLLHPQETKRLNAIFQVPYDLPLGEYCLYFGVEGQFLSANRKAYTSMSETQWSYPITLDVKYPRTNIKVFISHSTRDMYLVRELEKYLDNYGISPIIAEDISTPGAYLPKKFEKQIDDCEIILALLTFAGVRSKWVIYETNYALRIGKPSILLKEKDVELETPHEWVVFSRNEPIESIQRKVLSSIETIRTTLKRPITLPLGGVLLAGILIFLAGLAIGRRQ